MHPYNFVSAADIFQLNYLNQLTPVKCQFHFSKACEWMWIPIHTCVTELPRKCLPFKAWLLGNMYSHRLYGM